MQQIDDILALTEAVQEHIDAGRWAEAGVLERQRLDLLKTLFADGGLAELGEEGEKLARDLLSRTAGMTVEVNQRKGDLQEKTRQVNAAAKAVNAYRRNVPVDAWGKPQAGHVRSD